MPQIDPGVQDQKARRRIGTREQDRYDRKAAAFFFPLGLELEGKIHLFLLPTTQATWPDEDGDGGALPESLFQRSREGDPHGKIVLVKKGSESELLQTDSDQPD
jgi:hypothetical protein